MAKLTRLPDLQHCLFAFAAVLFVLTIENSDISIEHTLQLDWIATSGTPAVSYQLQSTTIS